MDELNAFMSGRTTLENHKNNMDDVNKENSFIKHITCSTLNEKWKLKQIFIHKL